MNIADRAERALALDPLRSFCVSAPAGSGKTELLIQRYLRLLARVQAPEQVLAITFTRKAAAEMRQRVVEALLAARDDLPCRDEHEKTTRELAHQALLADKAGSWQLTRDISRLNIKTIDSFCGGLIRQMPVLSQFGGQASVVDNAEDMYREAVSQLLAGLEAESPVSKDLSALMLHFDNNWQRVEELLVEMLHRRDQWRDYIGLRHTPKEAESFLVATVQTLVDSELGELAEVLEQFAPSITALQCYAAAHTGVPPLKQFPQPAASELPAWRLVRNMLLTKTGNWRKTVNKNDGFPADNAEQKRSKADLLELIGKLRESPGLEESLASLDHMPAMEAGEPSWQLVIHLFHVLPQLAAELLLVFSRYSQVDHSEVSMSALLALGEDDAPTELAMRLDYQIEHILVDEFQDTANSQYELVRKLTRGWGEHNATNPDSPRTIMIVGDGMQSIYGFRNANVGLFIQAREHGFNGVELEAVQLLCNFRSSAGIVEWVNSAFRNAFPERDDIFKGQVRFTDAVPVRTSSEAVAVECHAFAGEGALAEEVSYVCDLLESGIRDEDCGSIALLGRTRNQLQAFTRKLQERGVNYSAQDLDTLGDSPLVLDLMTLCRALVNPADRVAWLALLRAPWCGFSLTDLHVIGRLAGQDSAPAIRASLQGPALQGSLCADARTRLAHVLEVIDWAEATRDRLALRVWIEQAWLMLGGPATAVNPVQLRDAERFFQLLESADRDGIGLDLSRLQQQVDRLRLGEEQASSKLQVMTLHKAKGLEFDWVVIPGLSRRPRSDARALMLWDDYTSFTGERGFLLAADDHSESSEPTLYNYLRQQSKRKTLLENTRLLYVGATRAASRLWLTSGVEQAGEDGELKAPSSSSLLGSIWDTFSRDLVLHTSAEAAEEEVAVARPLRRLRDLPATRAWRGSTRDGEAPNIPERSNNRLDRHIGTVVHLALEELSYRSELPTRVGEPERQRWEMVLRRLGICGADLEQARNEVLKSVQAVVNDPMGRWILSSDHAEAYSEYALTWASPNGEVRDLVIDRTFLDRKSGDRWIVDYKSSSPHQDETMEDFLSRESMVYREQLSAYRQAILGYQTTPVRCALYFTALPAFHELDLGQGS